MDAVRRKSQKKFTERSQESAIELWKAKLPLNDIRKQSKMSRSTLRSSEGVAAEDSRV